MSVIAGDFAVKAGYGAIRTNRFSTRMGKTGAVLFLWHQDQQPA
ncbi:hypothetical protein [Oxalobacter formigenes]|nr:hypothetical protein [Oxalobacter formigenes]